WCREPLASRLPQYGMDVPRPASSKHPSFHVIPELRTSRANEQIPDRHGAPFSLDHFDFVMHSTVRGTVDAARQPPQHRGKADPREPAYERGLVVLVASGAAFEAHEGQVAYGASKGAIAGMTLPMARDLSRYGIRVVTIAPGIF